MTTNITRLSSWAQTETGPNITGSYSIGDKITANLPVGWVGDIQFTRTLLVSPFTKSNISGANASQVSTLSYTIVSGDLAYNIACDFNNLKYVGAGSNPVPKLPDAPTIGPLVNFGADGISQSATPPTNTGGSAITGYIMTVYRADNNAVLQTVQGATLPVSTSGLPVGIQVYTKISAVNSLGSGPQSASSNTVLIGTTVTVQSFAVNTFAVNT